MGEDLKNISGEFVLTIEETDYQMKMDYGVIEKLERQILNRPLLVILESALNGVVSISDVTEVLWQCMQRAKDTRLSRVQLGEKLVKNGIANFFDDYINVLNYAITGEMEVKTEPAAESKKK